MTANAVVSPIPALRHRTESPTAVSTMVRLVRQSFAVVEPQHDQVAQFFYGMLFSIAPSAREMFPANMQVQRSRLLRALVHIVQMVDRPDDLAPFLRQLGRDHRKFGVVSSHYEAVGTALIAAVKRHAGDHWTDEVERAWAEAYTIMARAMLDAADADDGPASWPARVIDHERLGWDLAVVRVQPDYAVPYQAGQYVSVEVPQRPRLWRYFTPANAPRADGVIEFHIRGVENGWVSRSIVAHAKIGDTWRIGPPMGRIQVDRTKDRNILMIAGGTGIAPMRAIIEDLAQWGENPRIHLFNGGRVPADLYDLPHLQNIAASNPWLTITPVLETEQPPGTEQGTLADIITRYGAWQDHEVLVAGSPSMIRSTVSRMLVAGTPLDHITYDPFTLD
ncbi:globin domain-containing protein [Actinokineospora inagensis]|uniref:globin domain-containing protein n=1 Tax=Actinokineospora inagensis TaxID=103730 RepID=UPI000478A6DA|nr:globin domain-containing protein [Actinokineospora inagensis]